MLKDMITQFVIACDGKEDYARKLQVIGILHDTNRIQVIIMDYPKGYIFRIKHKKVYEVSERFNKSELLAYVLKEILCAKVIIRRTLNIVKIKDDVDVKNFLDEQDEHCTPPRAITMPKTLITPEKK
ncbi:hypothetical protein Glove_22g44 [Diversispora epigaea]|uniref:Uncharacterized protein n=1 Tax=Diversispora epigaea TaxID=1348612 RepID=A0A397JJE5_9GLOM|nr:hypothetical protein Glove_22g44 [Diversispora epigaea]